MTEKINWYKEVLELEPNSKVFFPLARLLVEDGRREEAVATLERGLERHPEFLEARLLLIEILYQDNNRELCAAQVRRLNSMFASYAGFWQAWAACLGEEPEDADTASLLHFIAARFISGPLSLHEVINRGITAILSDKTARPDAESGAHAQPQPRKKRKTSPEKEKPAMPAESNAAEKIGAGNESRESAAMLEKAEALDAGMEQEEQAAADTADTLLEVARDAAETVADEKKMTAQVPEPVDAPEKEPASSAAKMESAPRRETPKTPRAAVIPMPAVNESAVEAVSAQGAVEEEPEEGGEHFSLRTRSMAEVLAEQGDYQGALDIYQELEASAANAAEQADLRRRIEDIKARAGLSDAEANNAGAGSEEDKEKLIGMLEALAHRVEARVGG